MHLLSCSPPAAPRWAESLPPCSPLLMAAPSPLHGSCLTPRQLMTPAPSPLATPRMRSRAASSHATNRLQHGMMAGISPLAAAASAKLWLNWFKILRSIIILRGYPRESDVTMLYKIKKTSRLFVLHKTRQMNLDPSKKIKRKYTYHVQTANGFFSLKKSDSLIRSVVATLYFG